MFNFHQLTKPKTLSQLIPSRLRPLLKASTALFMLGAFAQPALADPPVGFDVFCFRFTDIRSDQDDPENNKYTFEFEILNWTDQPAYDLDIALNTGTSDGLFLSNPGVDQNGAPLGPDEVWDPNPRGPQGMMLPDGSPALQGTPNEWSVQTSTSTYIRWDNGLADPINNWDIVEMGIPSWILEPGSFDPVDDGDNVLDGFTFVVDDFDPGETLSLNFFLGDMDGNPIATAGNTNPSQQGAFGTVSITLGDSNLGPVFQLPGGGTFNTGFRRTTAQFYDLVSIPAPETGGGSVTTAESNVFSAEFGAGGTAPFVNSDDSDAICGSGGCSVNLEVIPVPEPSSTVGLGLTALGMISYRLWRRKK
ncbi:MAG: PEP-CTERM sorting domain-containing protein [Microcystaceae cyanobacterium]